MSYWTSNLFSASWHDGPLTISNSTPYNGLSHTISTMRANRIAEFSYITLITLWSILCTGLCCAVWQSSDHVSCCWEKDKKIAGAKGAFASGRDAFISFPTSSSSTFTTDAIPQHIAKKSFSELQVWLERREACFAYSTQCITTTHVESIFTVHYFNTTVHIVISSMILCANE